MRRLDKMYGKGGKCLSDIVYQNKPLPSSPLQEHRGHTAHLSDNSHDFDLFSCKNLISHCSPILHPWIMVWTNLNLPYLRMLHIGSSFSGQLVSEKMIFKDFLYIFLWNNCGVTLPLGNMIWTNLNQPYLKMFPHKLQLFWLISYREDF